MRIAAISDIHGNLLALEAVLADIATRGADVTVNLGDILSGPLQAAATADLLMARGEIVTIAGNHERQLLQAWTQPADARDATSSDGRAAMEIGPRHADWLRTLPANRQLADDVLLVHGTPGSDLVYWLETVTPDFGRHGSSGMRPGTAAEVAERLGTGPAAAASLVLCGHTHVPRVVQCGGTLVVNPGSVGLQAYDDVHPYPHVVENGAPHARYALLDRTPAGWQVQLCSVAYDWQAQARVAAERGRPDWAVALATGRMPARSTVGAG